MRNKFGLIRGGVDHYERKRLQRKVNKLTEQNAKLRGKTYPVRVWPLAVVCCFLIYAGYKLTYYQYIEPHRDPTLVQLESGVEEDKIDELSDRLKDLIIRSSYDDFFEECLEGAQSSLGKGHESEILTQCTHLLDEQIKLRRAFVDAIGSARNSRDLSSVGRVPP